MASVQKARELDLISAEDAADHTNKILGGMHGGGGSDESVITGQGLAQQLIESGRGGSISESNPTGTRVVSIPPTVVGAYSEKPRTRSLRMAGPYWMAAAEAEEVEVEEGSRTVLRPMFTVASISKRGIGIVHGNGVVAPAQPWREVYRDTLNSYRPIWRL